MSLPGPCTLRPNNPPRGHTQGPTKVSLTGLHARWSLGRQTPVWGEMGKQFLWGSSPAFLLQSALLAHRSKRSPHCARDTLSPSKWPAALVIPLSGSPLAWSHLTSFAQVGTHLSCPLSGSLCMKTLSHPPLRVLSKLHLHAGLSLPAHPQRPPVSASSPTNHSSCWTPSSPLPLLGSSKAIPSSAAHRGCVNMIPEGSAGREAVLKLPVHLPLQGTTTQASHSRCFYENVQVCPREKGQATDSWRGKGRVPCSSLQPMWGL